MPNNSWTYLDYAATTQVTKPVLDAMLPYFTVYFGNPSSIHGMGKEAKKAITKARNQVAEAINAEPYQIIFTSGATEANTWVCKNSINILCSPIEHHSILNQPYATANQWGRIDGDVIMREFPYPDTAGTDLISYMYVNNETGLIQNVKEICSLAHDYGMRFHTDATQAFGHLPIDVKDLNVDFMSLSGHKFHAPKGIGVLYVKKPRSLFPLFFGGGQEDKLRAGTESVASIVGIGKAAELYKYNKDKDLKIKKICKDYMIKFIMNNIPDVRINSINNGKNKYVNNILNISIKDVESESLLIQMDMKGICISGGSACNSGSLEPSHVVKELHLPKEYEIGTVRFSFDETTTTEEIQYACHSLKTIVERLRKARNK